MFKFIFVLLFATGCAAEFDTEQVSQQPVKTEKPSTPANSTNDQSQQKDVGAGCSSVVRTFKTVVVDGKQVIVEIPVMCDPSVFIDKGRPQDFKNANLNSE